MKTFRIAVVSLSLLATTVGLATAQPRDPRFNGGPPPPPPMADHRDDHRDDHHDWRRGQRMDRNDWNRGGRVDYRERHLRQPPRGYEWREVDGTLVLGAIATGVIADIILNQR